MWGEVDNFVLLPQINCYAVEIYTELISFGKYGGQG